MVEKTKITEEMGYLFEEFGVNPILGRIFGVLLCSKTAISLIELSEILSLSKAAISIQIRVLEKLGYCQKLPKTKNRQHYYVLKDNYLEIVYKKRIEKEKAYLEVFENLKGDENESSTLINTRISEFISFNYFMINNQYKALSKWHKEQENEDSICQ